MSINAVQFQAGLSMPEFFAFYGTEAKCYRALYTWRWPQGESPRLSWRPVGVSQTDMA